MNALSDFLFDKIFPVLRFGREIQRLWSELDVKHSGTVWSSSNWEISSGIRGGRMLHADAYNTSG